MIDEARSQPLTPEEIEARLRRMERRGWLQGVVVAVTVFSVVASVLVIVASQRLDDVRTSQQETADSTACSRRLTAAHDVAVSDGVSTMLASQATLGASLLEAIATGTLSEPTAERIAVDQLPAIERAQADLDEARARRLRINEECPLPDR